MQACALVRSAKQATMLTGPAPCTQAIDVVVAAGTSGILARANQTLLRCWARSDWGPMPPDLMASLTRGLTRRAGLNRPHPAWVADAVDALECMAELARRERCSSSFPGGSGAEQDHFISNYVAGDAAGSPAAAQSRRRSSGGAGDAAPASDPWAADSDPHSSTQRSAARQQAPAEAGRRERRAPSAASCRPCNAREEEEEEWPGACGVPRGADADLVAAMCAEALVRVLHPDPASDGSHARLLPALMRAAGLLGCVPEPRLAALALERVRERARHDYGAADVHAAADALQLWAGDAPARALAAATVAVGEAAVKLAARGELGAEEGLGFGSGGRLRPRKQARQRAASPVRAAPDEHASALAWYNCT